MDRKRRFLSWPAWAALEIAAVLAACGPGAEPPDPHARYAEAVADARVAERDELSRDLTAIVPGNPDLVWENGIPGSRVLVVTWLGDAGRLYQCQDPRGCAGNTACLEGGECPNYRRDTWVTLAPQLRDFFAGRAPDPLRVAQLLGLPPEAGTPGAPGEYKYMLELWVSPKDLFRPCPDAEISDTTCELDFPSDPFRPVDPTRLVMAGSGPSRGTFMSYPDWFANQARYSYGPDGGAYPWTRMGYTYDWGGASPVGLSEFIVHGATPDGSGIPVGVHAVRTTREYLLR